MRRAARGPRRPVEPPSSCRPRTRRRQAPGCGSSLMFGTPSDRQDHLSTADLLASLHDLEDAPWGDWFGKPLTARGLARLLGPYRVAPRQRRVSGLPTRGYFAADFEDAWQRYVPSPHPRQVGQPVQAGRPRTRSRLAAMYRFPRRRSRKGRRDRPPVTRTHRASARPTTTAPTRLRTTVTGWDGVVAPARRRPRLRQIRVVERAGSTREHSRAACF